MLCKLTSWFTLIAVLAFYAPARADVRPIVAVFDIETRGIKLKKETVKQLSDYLAAKMAETGFFRVVPREDMRKRLLDKAKESYKECYDQSCQIELGKELAAQKILSTQIGKLGERCTITSTIYDLKRSSTDLSAVHSGTCDDEGLQKSLDEVISSLSKRKTAVLTPQERRQYLQEARNSIPAFTEDKPLSPYFFLLSENPQRDRLPLKKTEVQVDIAGMIADVRISQHYKNEGETVLEALYIFPVSSRGAISQMRMMIGERVISAEIQEKKQARTTYETARKEGRTASLLERIRSNVYLMNVANILPGDEIKVEFRYTELLVPRNGVYEFVYPAMSPPRYASSERPSSDSRSFATNPHLAKAKQDDSPLKIDMEIRSGIPVSRVDSPSHDLDIRFQGPKTVQVHSKERREEGDFVLRYSLAGKQIETGLLLYPGKDENFFLLMMEPPVRVSDTDIVPREYIFIMDVSGSMGGYPIETSKKLMHDLLSSLRETEYFNLIFFSEDCNTVFMKSAHATKGNIEIALAEVDRQYGGGGTNLLPALKSAQELSQHQGFSRTIVVVSDGHIHDADVALELVQTQLADANLFPFGIGYSLDRSTIESLARAGMGEPFTVARKEEAPEKADKFRIYISTPVLQGIEVEFTDFDTYDVEPKILGDLFAERPVVLFGKYNGEPSGSVLIEGKIPGKSIKNRLSLPDATVSERNRALRDLWARHRIQRLTDLHRSAQPNTRQDLRDQITKLGLKYGLVTDFTSFVAADQEERTAPESRMANNVWSRRRSPSVLTLEQAQQSEAQEESIDESTIDTPDMKLVDEFGFHDEFALLEESPFRRITFGINLDPVTVLASGDGGTLMHYGSVDFLIKWPGFRYWNPYFGLGTGYFAPRVRLGFDVYPLGYWSERWRPMLKLGGRYMVAFNLSDAPDDYDNFDTDTDYVTGFLGEVGIGIQFQMLDRTWQLVAMYLVGPAWPAKGGDDRAFGDSKPTGSALFHGGTLSLTFEF